MKERMHEKREREREDDELCNSPLERATGNVKNGIIFIAVINMRFHIFFHSGKMYTLLVIKSIIF